MNSLYMPGPVGFELELFRTEEASNDTFLIMDLQVSSVMKPLLELPQADRALIGRQSVRLLDVPRHVVFASEHFSTLPTC